MTQVRNSTDIEDKRDHITRRDMLKRFFQDSFFLYVLATSSCVNLQNKKPFEYYNERFDRKIDISTTITHVENEWDGFGKNPSKEEKHLEMEKEFFSHVKGIESSDFEKAVQIYEYVTNRLKGRELPNNIDHSDGTLGQILEYGGGVCVHISGALYDAYKADGLKTDVIRAWVRLYLAVNDKAVCLDLDPTWYKKFKPLKPTTQFEEIIIEGNNGIITPQEYLRRWHNITDIEIDKIIDKYTLKEYK